MFERVKQKELDKTIMEEDFISILEMFTREANKNRERESASSNC